MKIRKEDNINGRQLGKENQLRKPPSEDNKMTDRIQPYPMYPMGDNSEGRQPQ